MPRRSITSYDVAKAAGVSQSAVSRAFSPDGSIAEKTRKHILSIAGEMGYQPNAIARSMSTARTDVRQKSGIVGVIVTRLQDPFFANTIAHFSRDLQAKGWQMLLFSVDTQNEVDDALSSLMQFKIDGVIVLSAILSEHMARSARRRERLLCYTIATRRMRGYAQSRSIIMKAAKLRLRFFWKPGMNESPLSVEDLQIQPPSNANAALSSALTKAD